VRASAQHARQQSRTATRGVLEPAILTLADARLNMRTPDDATIAAVLITWR